MEIRSLSLEDAPAWLAIRSRMLKEHPESFGADSADFEGTTVAEIEARIAANSGPDSIMYGGFDGELLVGTIGFFQRGGTKRLHVREIWGMYVAPEARRLGVGRALLERALADIRQLPGVLRVGLEVSVSNTQARALYEELGFEAYGIEPSGLKIGDHLEDTVLMSRKL